MLGTCLAACRTAPPGPVDGLLAQHAQVLGQVRQLSPGLELRCGPEEAEVAVDGVLQGSCADVQGRVLFLDEGIHRVEVKRAGFRPYEVQLAAGKARTRLTVELTPSG